MPELNDAERAKEIAKLNAKVVARRLASVYEDIIGQMKHNIERAEREGTMEAPALDGNNNPPGKTQYEIDKEILAKYQADLATVKSINPDAFPVEVNP